jgi:large subunit ribosomal protein L22
MIITATQKNTRQTPLKVRLVANQVKKLSLQDAIVQLGVIERRASLVILKLIRQAVADAVHNHSYNVSDLTLKNIVVTPGPVYKRFQPVSRGRAHSILKRTCHITVELVASDKTEKSTSTQKTKSKSKKDKAGEK